MRGGGRQGPKAAGVRSSVEGRRWGGWGEQARGDQDSLRLWGAGTMGSKWKGNRRQGASCLPLTTCCTASLLPAHYHLPPYCLAPQLPLLLPFYCPHYLPHYLPYHISLDCLFPTACLTTCPLTACLPIAPIFCPIAIPLNASPLSSPSLPAHYCPPHHCLQ